MQFGLCIFVSILVDISHLFLICIQDKPVKDKEDSMAGKFGFVLFYFVLWCVQFEKLNLVCL